MARTKKLKKDIAALRRDVDNLIALVAPQKQSMDERISSATLLEKNHLLIVNEIAMAALLKRVMNLPEVDIEISREIEQLLTEIGYQIAR